MIRIAICDEDENSCYLARDCFAEVLTKSGDEHKIEIFFESEKLFEALHDRLFEFIVCDASVGDRDMIEFAAALRAERYPANMIYITDRTDRMREAQNIFPFAYIQKPITTEIADKMMDFAACFHAPARRFYVSAKNGEKYMIDESEIMYIEVFRNDICIHMTGRDVVCRYTLTGFLKKLSGAFIRCHQSYAVNMTYAVGIRRYTVELSGGKNVPVSKNNYGYVRDRLTRGRSSR